MIDQRTLQLLDWPRIAKALAERARTPFGHEACLAVEPLAPPAAAEIRQRVTAWRAVLVSGRDAPLSNVPDVRAELADVRRGATFDGRMLLDTAAVMDLVSELGRFLGGSEADASLRGLAESLPDFSAIATRINKVIDPSGGVREDASEDLQRAAHEERSRSTELRQRAEALLDDERFKPLLRDRYVTQREGRFVLPVKIERSGAERGIVHDASASGATVFFEPEELGHANNRLVEVRAVIREEIARLLGELSRAVAAVAEELQDALVVVGQIDAEVARARLAQEWEAVEPVDAPDVFLLDAKQPLLLLRAMDVVAVDIRHPGNGRAMILSGPNAGGKTAALKTIGLAIVLARSGCHVPAREARFPLAWDVGVELGDPQNLGEDLSTFSGHLARLSVLGKLAKPGMLMLVDELLKGTDPADGAPLARAWLEEMIGAGAPVWVTTHYGSIKALASFDERFLAARTAYESGLPAYTIVYGEAGPSYAFETAIRLGFSDRIIERARGYRKGEVSQAERALSEVDDLRKQLGRAKIQAEADAKEQRLLRDRLQAELDMMQRDRTTLVRRSAETTLTKIESARAAAEQAEKVVKRHQDQGKRKRIELSKSRENVERTVAEMEVPGSVDAAQLTVGKTVYSRRLKRNGVVARPPERGQVVLKVGQMQVTVKVADLAPAQSEAGIPKATRRMQAAPAVPEKLDIKGLRLDEAISKVDPWIDGALLAGQTGSLILVHGIGSGQLRNGIRAYLREHPAGLPYGAGTPDQGGDAVTVIGLGG